MNTPEYKSHPVPEIEESLFALRFTASALDDTERIKIAQQNRLRIMLSAEPDADGITRGFSLDQNDPNVVIARTTVDALQKVEDDLVKELQKQLKRTPFAAWTKSRRGVGEKQVARLLSSIGDPYWRSEDVLNITDSPVTKADGTVVKSGEVLYPAGPRTFNELQAYVGIHTVENPEGGDRLAARRRKGTKANWNATAKSRAWLIIQSCLKQIDAECKREDGIGIHSDTCRCSKYRKVIDERRLHTEETHPDWTPGHSLQDAMRIAMRELLRDLWKESRRLHWEATLTQELPVAA